MNWDDLIATTIGVSVAVLIACAAVMAVWGTYHCITGGCQ